MKGVHTIDVVGIGEAMALFVPDGEPLGIATRHSLSVAGAEANVLIGLSRLGHTCDYLSAVGDDPFGSYIVRTLAEQGVGTASVVRDPAHRTGVFFKDPTPSAQRQVYYYRNNSAASHLGPQELSRVERLRPRALVVSGLTLGLGGDDGLGRLASAAIRRARELDVQVVFDANLRRGVWSGSRAASHFREVSDGIDVLLTGREELAALVPDTDPEVAAASLVEAGCWAVILKDGADGALVIDAQRSVHVPAVEVDEIVDPVGAGDAFATGVVSGLLRGWAVVDGARLGAALAAHVITVHGDWEALPAGTAAQDMVEEIASNIGVAT